MSKNLLKDVKLQTKIFSKNATCSGQQIVKRNKLFMYLIIVYFNTRKDILQ